MTPPTDEEGKLLTSYSEFKISGSILTFKAEENKLLMEYCLD
jgi:hypothetical protein